eukprot:scaffold1112_cov116-Isochrysis_galbana.AAC.46
MAVGESQATDNNERKNNAQRNAALCAARNMQHATTHMHRAPPQQSRHPTSTHRRRYPPARHWRSLERRFRLTRELVLGRRLVRLGALLCLLTAAKEALLGRLAHLPLIPLGVRRPLTFVSPISPVRRHVSIHPVYVTRAAGFPGRLLAPLAPALPARRLLVLSRALPRDILLLCPLARLLGVDARLARRRVMRRLLVSLTHQCVVQHRAIAHALLHLEELEGQPRPQLEQPDAHLLILGRAAPHVVLRQLHLLVVVSLGR